MSNKNSLHIRKYRCIVGMHPLTLLCKKLNFESPKLRVYLMLTRARWMDMDLFYVGLGLIQTPCMHTSFLFEWFKTPHNIIQNVLLNDNCNRVIFYVTIVFFLFLKFSKVLLVPLGSSRRLGRL